MQGQSISHLINLAGVPIIPRHIWELAGDKTYKDVGKADPAKTSTGYDMLVAGTFIGSGPFMCRSVFPVDLGKIGTGCAQNAGVSSSTGCADYSYWLRPAFHSGTATIGIEESIVASHLDDTWVSPFSWSGVQSMQPGQTLQNIVPFTP